MYDLLQFFWFGLMSDTRADARAQRVLNIPKFSKYLKAFQIFISQKYVFTRTLKATKRTFLALRTLARSRLESSW